MFQIVRIDPLHHHSTDAIIGCQCSWRGEYAYHNPKCAGAIAARMQCADYERGGDGVFYVIRHGGSALKPIHDAIQAVQDELFDCPF